MGTASARSISQFEPLSFFSISYMLVISELVPHLHAARKRPMPRAACEHMSERACVAHRRDSGSGNRSTQVRQLAHVAVIGPLRRAGWPTLGSVPVYHIQ